MAAIVASIVSFQCLLLITLSTHQQLEVDIALAAITEIVTESFARSACVFVDLRLAT